MLEVARNGLVSKRMGLENKIQELEARRAGATREEAEVVAGRGRERKR